MEVIAWDKDQRYLVSLDGNTDEVQKNEEALGRVLDMDVKKLIYPVSIHRLLTKNPGWFDYTMPEEQLCEMIAQCEDVTN